MRALAGAAVVAFVITLAACGGGDGGTSADELERRLTEPSPIENEDPVVKADCPDDLGDDSGAEVNCTTTTRSGVVSKVTVRNQDGGLAFESVSVGAPEEETPSNPADVRRLERAIRGSHNSRYVGEDRSRRATTVDCPDDFVEETGAATSCMVSLADGSVVSYEVQVTAKRVSYFPDPFPGDFLAKGVLADWNGQDPRDRGESVECPGQLPIVKGTSTTCTLTTVDGKTRDVEVTVTNEKTAHFSIDY